MKNRNKIIHLWLLQVSPQAFPPSCELPEQCIRDIDKDGLFFNIEALFMHRLRSLHKCDRQQKELKFTENKTSKSSEIFK